MILYVDTSALVPLLIDEPASGACGLRGYDATHCAAAVAANDADFVAASGPSGRSPLQIVDFGRQHRR